MNGGMAAGRWDELEAGKEGQFIYAPALASYDMDEVWAWTPLSPDSIFELEEEREQEKKREEELNRNPSVDNDLFKYGTDIDAYYQKALDKLRIKYPWATVTQMKKTEPYKIVPHHGRMVFGLTTSMYKGSVAIEEWTEGSTAEEFVDFLCKYTEESVKNSNPEEKFRYGMDINTYLEKAYENVKKDYHWLDKKMLKGSWHYEIRQVNGDWEFVSVNNEDGKCFVCDCRNAEEFIKRVEYDYEDGALAANPVVSRYEVPFGHIEIHGWNLEQYAFSKLKTGDYKVNVQAGDRVTGGSREFFITPYCFEADTYEEFLDRYLEIVPGRSFGLDKEDLLADKKLRKFLGY